MKERTALLTERYRQFEVQGAPYTRGAACARGCAFCCRQAGSIDITTLEGLRIREAIAGMPRARQQAVRRALAREMKRREAGEVVPCPFLQRDDACMIYELRPFACRRIYSVHRCSEQEPPALSRRYLALGETVQHALQRLDANGYSGHITFILYMLDAPRFLETYLAGDLRPEEVVAFGKAHRIAINRVVAGRS
jgi:Fe-S-cluster containining protein